MFSFGTFSFGLVSFEIRIPVSIRIGSGPKKEKLGDDSESASVSTVQSLATSGTQSLVTYGKDTAKNIGNQIFDNMATIPSGRRNPTSLLILLFLSHGLTAYWYFSLLSGRDSFFHPVLEFIGLILVWMASLSIGTTFIMITGMGSAAVWANCFAFLLAINWVVHNVHGNDGPHEIYSTPMLPTLIFTMAIFVVHFVSFARVGVFLYSDEKRWLSFWRDGQVDQKISRT